MVFTGYEITWLFFVYAFLGWVLETVAAAAKQKRFVNRGLINAPLCVIYGIGAILITVTLRELRGFWLFLGILIFTTVLEWTAGHLIEKMYHEKWWDYSQVHWNMDGYICLPVSLLWGVLGMIVIKWGNPFLLDVFRSIPVLPGKIFVLVLSGVLAVDAAATLILLSGRSKRRAQWEAADAWLTGISSSLGRWIYQKVDARIQKSVSGVQERGNRFQGQYGICRGM